MTDFVYLLCCIKQFKYHSISLSKIKKKHSAEKKSGTCSMMTFIDFVRVEPVLLSDHIIRFQLPGYGQVILLKSVAILLCYQKDLKMAAGE